MRRSFSSCGLSLARRSAVRTMLTTALTTMLTTALAAVPSAALLLGLPAPARADGSGAATPCVKTLAWSHDPPNTLRLADGEVGGVEIDLHRELFKALGCELRLEELPFARALIELQSGRVDLIPATLARPERLRYALFSKPLLYLHNVLYVRAADVPRTQGLRLVDLVDSGWRLGGQVGVVYGSEFAALLDDPRRAAKISRVPHRASLWKMLDRQRVDGVLANQLTAQHELAQMGLSERLRPTDIALPVESGGTAWSRASTDEAFVRRFNLALDSLRSSKRYGELLAPYGLSASGQLLQRQP
jgi:polar amino acid transport system substrate-binding protein